MMDPPLHRTEVYRWKSEKWFAVELAALRMEQADIAKEQLWTHYVVPLKVKTDGKGNPILGKDGKKQYESAKPSLTGLIYWLNMTGDDVGFDLERALKQEELQRREKARLKKQRGARRIVRPMKTEET